MRETKFNLNALLLVIMLFSALIFVFVIKFVDMADLAAVNSFYPVEGTKVGVRYSSAQPYGLYEGTKESGQLKLEGFFGYDWGAAAVNNELYINEYVQTDLGLMLCRLVRVDLDTYEKTVLRRDTMLRGRCASGELVCVEGFIMPADYPKTNALCGLYALSAEAIQPEGDGATVLYLDPETGDVLYSVWDEEALLETFSEKYIERTLEEVKK